MDQMLYSPNRTHLNQAHHQKKKNYKISESDSAKPRNIGTLLRGFLKILRAWLIWLSRWEKPVEIEW